MYTYAINYVYIYIVYIYIYRERDIDIYRRERVGRPAIIDSGRLSETIGPEMFHGYALVFVKVMPRLTAC